MHRDLYNTRAWRDLPRDYCLVEVFFGEAVGPCAGLIAHHHVNPNKRDSRTVQVCARHHPKLEAALRKLAAEPAKRCSHRHHYPGAREACERRLNAIPAIP